MRKILRVSWFLLVALTLSLSACEDKKDGGGDEKKEEGGGGEEAAVEAVPTELEGLGLMTTIPPDAKIEDLLENKTIKVGKAPDMMTITIGPAQSYTPLDVQAAIDAAAPFKPEKMEELEVADGYGITFENTGGNGRNYFVELRRVLGEQDVSCKARANSLEHKQIALEACQSLAAK